MKLATKLRVTVPCILIFGAIGALVGGATGYDIGGIRAGIIVGGIVAYFSLKRKDSGAH